ncbi:multidrug ABC transporter permease [Rhodospirillum rubrum]|uniref:ABC transporter permease n=1 Tax=Rhodospirillum rubrum TaxID=1085 RepID=UPI001907A89C|nr:ABC transporter permease [Rhodospirillum rubrum]MBK1666271.1 multidrug ABC transporter permease [Rhodospirillum rubrum]MBK1678467.1 multidrug ABC transporter permease [Rhodospirillum rubrum]
MKDASAGFSIPQPRHIGAVNWLGLWELYLKEVRRFLKVYLQTLAAPLVTTLIFLAIFALSVGPQTAQGGLGFMEFLAPGLIMMAMVQNAFANTSSSLIIAKVQGNIVDVLMPPLNATELTLAYALGGVTRGVMVGIFVAVGMMAFVTLHIHSVFFIVYHALGASLMLSLLGMIAGIWADKFDHMASVTNFIVTPLSFLSGTFYTIDRLPESLRFLAHLNPFFYMIDGFRFGFIGHDQAMPITGLVVVGGFNVVLAAVCWQMFRTGYKLKA